MGSVYAGLLADAGNEVWAVDINKEHVDTIRAHGLRVEGASGDRVVHIHATCDPSEVPACDLIVISTKGGDVEAAVESIRSLVGPETVILTMQNGIGSPEKVARMYPAEQIMVGVAGGFGSSLKGPGHVHHHGMELIRLGEMKGGETPRLERIVRVWQDAGFNVKGYGVIDQLIWEKFICNVTFSGTCTTLGWTIGEVMGNEDSWKIALGCGLEAYNVGLARGVRFSFSDTAAYITAFGRKMPGARPSMLLDHMARKRSEIDVINGMVPVLAREAGMSAPFNEVIVAIVKAKEAHFE
jgi:2-dehydropantoate 2-reductase